LIEIPLEGSTEKKWVLLIGINPGAPLGGSINIYFVGSFDGTSFRSDDTNDGLHVCTAIFFMQNGSPAEISWRTERGSVMAESLGAYTLKSTWPCSVSGQCQ
jgi:hypothetical protein